MGRLFKIFPQFILATVIVTLWFTIAILLCQLIPYTKLLEIFLVTVGSLLLACGGVIFTREVSKLIDLRHWQRIRQELRELELRERKREHLPLAIKLRRTRNYYH